MPLSAGAMEQTEESNEPLIDQAARTLIEQCGDNAAQVVREQAEAADRIGDNRRAEYWCLIAHGLACPCGSGSMRLFPFVF